jgi:S1-C subfamily serine protease
VGLRAGDVIVGINGRPVLGFAELRAAMRPEAGGARMATVLRVFRAGRYFQVPLG